LLPLIQIVQEAIDKYIQYDENFRWSSKQAYIGLGTGLIAAATFKFDATPMRVSIATNLAGYYG
jgi:hypothetical protein